MGDAGVRGVVAAGLVLVLAGCAAGGGAGGATVRRATAVGVPVRVASFALWNERCEAVGVPEAVVTGGPRHGTLEVRRATLTAGRRLAGGTDCRDRQVPGVELWYAPEAGFRGTDRMDYRVDAGEGALAYAATVDVR